MKGDSVKAFISYKWEDRAHNDWVTKLASDLRAAGIEAILDRWEVRFGDSFTDYMTSKIAQADVFLFIMTSKSVEAVESAAGQGGAIKFEIQMATARRISGEKLRVIPIYREGTKTAAHVRDHRYADFRNDLTYHERIEELIKDLKGSLDVPPLADIGTEWSSPYVFGSSFLLESGIAGTRNAPNGHPLSTFPLDTTVILGDSGKRNPQNPDERTIARWEIPTGGFPVEDYTRGHLVIACLRHFGGLHSPTLKDGVEILLNGKSLDGFELQHVPDGHQDFFHEVPEPSLLLEAPIADCKRIYSWRVPKSHLAIGSVQGLEIRLSRDAKWDIDFIGLVFEKPKKSSPESQ